MISARKFLVLAAAFVGASTAGYCSAEAANPETALKEASAALLAHPSFRLEASIAYHGKFQGNDESVTTKFDIAIKRPDQVSVHVQNPQSEIYIYGNGKELTRFVPAFKQYVSEPKTLAPQEIVAMAGFELIDAALLALAEAGSIKPFDGAQSFKLVGNEEVKGQPCERIHFTFRDRSYDLWIDSAPTRLIRQIEVDMAPEEAKFAEHYGTTFDFKTVASLDKWDFDADVSSQLAFAPAEGVQKVASFMPPRPEQPAEKLKGEPAPDFTAKVLDSGDVTLAKLKGSVVILDFWATWCGPCREGLPVMQQLSIEYAGKGVNFYAVNGGEDAATVKPFLASNGLDKLKVLMDPEGTVTALYKANAIPQTVIVGPDGVVRSVHIGIPNDPAITGKAGSQEEFTKLLRESYAKSLRAEIDEILQAPKK